MPYCHECGANLPDGFKFCPLCGSKVVTLSAGADNGPKVDPAPGNTTGSTGTAPSPGGTPGSARTDPAPTGADYHFHESAVSDSAPAREEARDKKRRRGILLACMLVFLTVASLFLLAKRKPPVIYENYVNDMVKFSIDYPDTFQLTEPYDNVAMIQDGDDFRMAVEYTFQTVSGDSYIYSAADFRALYDQDQQVVTDFLGAGDVRLYLETPSTETVAGMKAYTFPYYILDNGRKDGCLYVFDGQGDFGVYCISTLADQNADDPDRYEETLEHMLASFSITEAYEAPGFSFCPVGEMQFMVRDDHLNYTDAGIFCPAGTDPEQANVVPWATVSRFENITDAIEDANSFYVYAYNAQPASQLNQFHRGLYDCCTMDISYVYQDRQYIRTVIALDLDKSDGPGLNEYYVIVADYTPAYQDPTMALMNDFLMSARLTD